MKTNNLKANLSLGPVQIFRSVGGLVLGTLLMQASLQSCTGPRGELGTEANPIKFYFIPSVDANMLNAKTKVIEAYLEANTPYKFEIGVPNSYIAVVEAMGTKRADVAAMNTFGYILAHEKYGAQALMTVMRFGSDSYKAQIIAKTDGPIKNLSDIDGKKVAYVDPASTSGYLLPAQLFKTKGIKPKEYIFAKKHDNVVMAVYQGQVDAGATFYSPPEDGIIQDARRLVKTQYPDVEQKIKIVETTDSIPNDPIVFRKEMPEDMKKAIVQALLNMMKTVDGKAAFKDLYSVTDLKITTDASYDGVRSMLQALGKSSQELVKDK